MTFRPEAVGTFLKLFDDTSGRIREFDGCHRLELWGDAHDSNVFTTFSLWTDVRALDAYRDSELFRSTWSLAKALFAAPPTASSHTRVRDVY